MTYVANQLDCVLQTADSINSGTGDEHAQKVIQVYDALCKQIRALDLPLNVNTLQGISPVFRGAEVWQKNCSIYNASIRLIIVL